MRTLVLLGAAAMAACTTACSRPLSAPAPERVTYENTIRALVAARCADCHGPESPTLADFKKDKKKYQDEETGPRMDTYENLTVFVNGADTGALMRRLDDGTNTKDGKPGNMNEHLGKTPAERAANLALFKRWVGGWSLKRAKEMSPEERAAVLAPRQ